MKDTQEAPLREQVAVEGLGKISAKSLATSAQACY